VLVLPPAPVVPAVEVFPPVAFVPPVALAPPLPVAVIDSLFAHPSVAATIDAPSQHRSGEGDLGIV